MKLLRINIHGFKSFADKVTIDIKDGITGIVGPNGSGKSNIVDAIRWVLGEQSIKDIRGGNISSDVIFGGSKSRNALTRGWVSLVFDNSDHYLKSDLNEVEIKRVVYRTGENEYYINSNQVRLKDITDLFIDSGSSVNSLSIISQNKVTDILNGKAEDKMRFLEEAAGVLKYKKRKEETLRKLDKTNDNLSRINLIIDELTVNLNPLKEQAASASKYLNYKADLERIEIALLAHDIKIINDEYASGKEKKDLLTKEILMMDNLSVTDNTRVDSLKLKLLKMEEEISDKSQKLYYLTNDLASLASEKQIMMERAKYEVEDAKLETNILNLKEKELHHKNFIVSLKEQIKTNDDNLKEKQNINASLINELKILNINKNNLLNELQILSREEINLNSKIEIINEQIENDGRLPYPVKSVLNNPRLNGIHNALGKLIEVSEKEAYAIDTALGYTANYIVVDNEISAKEAISFLKQGGYGRATFLPINVIKPRAVDPATLNKIETDPAFIGIAEKLVKYSPIYRNIILNQLGNVIIAEDLNGANRIGKLINYSYKIVTLEGDLIASGGSITGGSSKNASGMLNQKYELESLINKQKEIISSIKIKEEEINDNNNQIKILENNVFNSENELSSLKDLILRKNAEITSLEQEVLSIVNEIKGTKGLKEGSIDKEIETILNKYYEVSTGRDSLELNLNDLRIKKNDLASEINELELNNKKATSEYNTKNNALKEIEINLGRLDIRLENLLSRLNEEYNLTYEKAIIDYELSESEHTARIKVNSLKSSIKALGEVNIGAISEYERINNRYTFLNSQKEDLLIAIEDILKVINELDGEMKIKLTNTFTELNKEFTKVFKQLFRGGEADLVLTNPEDILNTGMDIKAIPPGKDIKNTRLLSGGEATLTAIALLFAILNIRTVPFCILDEVESALDEVNVDMFSNYLKGLNSKTQFILITHKKRTMEYTDHLYGITMQESGVSKLVSVKLD